MRILAYPLLALGLLFVIVTVTHGTILPDISLFYVLLPFLCVTPLRLQPNDALGHANTYRVIFPKRRDTLAQHKVLLHIHYSSNAVEDVR